MSLCPGADEPGNFLPAFAGVWPGTVCDGFGIPKKQEAQQDEMFFTVKSCKC